MDELLFRPEPFAGFMADRGGHCGCAACGGAEPELELEDGTGESAWSRWGTDYVTWLQTALNKVRPKLKLAVTGKPDHRTVSALGSVQHDMGKHARMGMVGSGTSRRLIKLGASPPPKRPIPPKVGIDVNFDTRKHLACFQKASFAGVPISFAVRYYSYTPSKNLSRREADALAKAGIRCAVVWESRAASATGYKQGQRHAASALKQAVTCGQPAGTPIYFAIDFPPSASQRAGIERYFEGVRDTLNAATTRRYTAGVYGNRDALDWCKAQGITTHFWQGCSKLTAHGTNQFRWPGVNMHQVLCERSICNVHVDWNESDGREGSWFPA